MTYTEAARVAEENARWIRNNDAERMRKVEQLERARAVIAAALNIDPIVAEPEGPPPTDNVVSLMDPVPCALEGEDAA
jgi:hypothetical protein